MNPYYPKLYEPITIGKKTFRNRIWFTPNMLNNIDHFGRSDDAFLNYFRERAMGGAAVVSLGICVVDREHAGAEDNSFIITPENQGYFSEIAKAIHEGGAMACQELQHVGNIASLAGNRDADPNGWQSWGPMDLHGKTKAMGMEREINVHGMNEEEMNVVADHFAYRAELLKKAGFDMVLIHGGHGFLLDQFLSPKTNKRTDNYGGSLENRARFPLMVVDRVRQRCGPDFLIEYRYSVDERVEGGITAEEGVEFAKMLDGKVDIIHASASLDTDPIGTLYCHSTMYMPQGLNVGYAEAIKKAGVKTPVLTVGGISTPELAEKILEEGKADMIGMCRSLIADPYLPEKAKHGHPEDIIPCQRCNECICQIQVGNQLSCAVNGRTLSEERYDRIKPAREKRKVLVAGGGPGGMKAAATAAQRGHDVTLAEATDQLGGNLKFADYDAVKIGLTRLKNHLSAQIEKTGVHVLYNTEVTPEFVSKGGYDAVIVATGSSPLTPPVPGLEKATHATDVYAAPDNLDKNVVIIGGGLVGCETAVFLAEHGHSVTVVEMSEAIAQDANFMTRGSLMMTMRQHAVTCRTSLRVCKISETSVTALDTEGHTVEIPADSVVYAMGMRPCNTLAKALEEKTSVVDIIPIGDACGARKIRQAMEEGFWAAVRLS